MNGFSGICRCLFRFGPMSKSEEQPNYFVNLLLSKGRHSLNLNLIFIRFNEFSHHKCNLLHLLLLLLLAIFLHRHFPLVTKSIARISRENCVYNPNLKVQMYKHRRRCLHRIKRPVIVNLIEN